MHNVNSQPRDNPPLLALTRFDLLAFPSPFRDWCGICITEWEEGRCVIELAPRPYLMNNAGVLAGAVVGATVDMAGQLAGCYSGDPDRRVQAVTISLTVGYMLATPGPIRAVGIFKGGGRKVYNATVDVFDQSQRTIATGQGSYRYIAAAN